MFGDQPSLLDVTVFSFIVMLVTLPENSDSKMKKYLEKELPNLVQHFERIKEKYWPHWEEAKHK